MRDEGSGRLQIPFDLREEQREGDRIYVTSSWLGGGNRFSTSRLRVSYPSSVPDLFSYHTRGGSGVDVGWGRLRRPGRRGKTHGAGTRATQASPPRTTQPPPLRRRCHTIPGLQSTYG